MNNTLKIGAIVAVTMLALSGPVQAGKGKNFDFTGYWEAIDQSDGAKVNQSINEREDGTFSYLRRNTLFQMCGGLNGWATGDGVLLDKKTLHVTNMVLNCADGTSTPLPPHAYAQFVGDKDYDTMTETFSLAPGLHIIHHRISKK